VKEFNGVYFPLVIKELRDKTGDNVLSRSSKNETFKVKIEVVDIFGNKTAKSIVLSPPIYFGR